MSELVNQTLHPGSLGSSKEQPRVTPGKHASSQTASIVPNLEYISKLVKQTFHPGFSENIKKQTRVTLCKPCGFQKFVNHAKTSSTSPNW
eukprot:6166795-Pleurochrysis_carterae.AAC.2